MTVIRIPIAVCVLVFAFACLASAQEWGRVMTPDRPLNVRTGRSLNSSRVTTIMPGENVRMDFTKGDWSAVFPLSVTKRAEANALGYVKTKYLKAAGKGGAAWGRFLAPKGMLNVRKKRDRNSEHVVTLKQGQVVKADFEKDGWLAVFKPDESVRDERRALGYARAKYLFPAAAKPVTAKPAPGKPAPGKPAPAKAGDSIKASAQAAPAAAQQAGVTVKVQPAEAPPAVSPRHVSTDTPAQTEAPAWGRVVVLERRANVREKRTAGSGLVATLKQGDTVRVDFLDRGWYAVFRVSETKRDLNKALGYVYAPLLGEAATDIQTHTLRPKTRETSPPMAATAVPESGSPGLHSQPVVQSGADGKDSMTIVPVDQGDEPHKGPVPRADRVRHGFRFGIIDRNASASAALGRQLVKVYLDLTVVPDDASLRDFAATIAGEEMGDSKELLVLIYLPGQDTRDLAYCQAKFDTTGLLEFWTRRSTLYGTHFLP